MSVTRQIIEFIGFTSIGVILAMIFDVFRAYRKMKKVDNKTLMVQDILYFLIATVIVLLGVVYILESSIRFYVFVAMALGIYGYAHLLSKHVVRMLMKSFHLIRRITSFLGITLVLFYQILQKIVEIMKKIVKKCCKNFFYVVSFKCKHSKFFSKEKKENAKEGKNMKSKNLQKKSVKKKKKSKNVNIVHIVSILFMIYFVYTFYDQQIKINNYNSQIEMYESDIEAKRNLAEYYNNQSQNIQTDEYIESVAREKLGYVKPYEKIFIDANR